MNHIERTTIYRSSGGRVETPASQSEVETAVGYLLPNGEIHRLRWNEGKQVGRFDDEGRVYRLTAHGERELGQARADGTVFSAGLFAGGAAGWVAESGVVVQAGLILGEEEVGRVEGPDAAAAGAALLLLFLPDERETEHRQGQGTHE